MGVHVVQIADNLPLDRLSDSELDALAQRADELNISIELGMRGIARDHLYTYLQLAQRMRSPILRLVADTADYQPSEDEVVNVVSTIIPEFERANVCLAIENHDRFPIRTLRRILERVNSEHIGICLDTANSFGALEGPEVVVEALRPWIVNVHLKDFSMNRPKHRMGIIIEGRPAGQGQLDIPWLLQEILAHARDPNVILELWTPPQQTLQETLDKEKAWAIASIEYLRQLITD
jgi:sugar phosphate isomerase/epimerase